VEALLAELEPLLYGYNDQVFLRAYRLPFRPGALAEWYITQVLGPSVVIGGVFPATASDIIAEVEQSLQYLGGAGSGPKPAALRSRRFKAIVPAVLAELERAIAGAELLAQFWL